MSEIEIDDEFDEVIEKLAKSACEELAKTDQHAELRGKLRASIILASGCEWSKAEQRGILKSLARDIQLLMANCSLECYRAGFLDGAAFMANENESQIEEEEAI
jgi:hypothetical protein